MSPDTQIHRRSLKNAKVQLKVKHSIDSNQVQGASMKDIDYALMLIKANKLDGAKDLLEELLKSDPKDKDIQ